MNSFKSTHLVLAVIVLLIALMGVLVTQAKHTYEPVSAAPLPASSSATIFTKDKTYQLTMAFGVGQRRVDCKVLDTRDNWVRCDGTVYGVNGKPDYTFVAWLNTQYISWVHDLSGTSK